MYNVIFYAFLFNLTQNRNFLTLKEQYDYYDLVEEIEPLRDNSGNFLGIEDTVIIPFECRKKELEIKTNIFSGIKQYKKMEAKDEFYILLKLINNSKFDYEYKDESLKIDYDIENDQGKYNSILRSYNSALKNLFKTKYQDEFLTNECLNKKLKELNYSGVEELHKYYLDYYNEKYKKDYMSIEEFPFYIKNEILEGDVSFIFENNINIINLAQNYYREVMNDNIFLNRSFNKMNVKTLKDKTINLKIKISNNLPEVYELYNYPLKFSFKLVKR